MPFFITFIQNYLLYISSMLRKWNVASIQQANTNRDISFAVDR